MISLKRIHLNSEVVSYEFHPNAGDDFGIVELNRKNNICENCNNKLNITS